MNTDHRMKEITGNLKQDMKDLLNESANLVTGFFKRGVCTVRAVADKWRAFAHDISDAVDHLMKPSFVEGPEAPAVTLDPEAEPIVTVTESAAPQFPVGKQMPLSQAEEAVRQADQECREAGQAPQAVRVKIDYIKDGQTDRYWLPLEIGAGGSLLEQMQSRLEAYRSNAEKIEQLFADVPEEYRDILHQEFAPFLHDNLNGPSQTLLRYFQRHCDIAAFEQNLQERVSMLPERQQEKIRQVNRDTVTTLRRAANTGASPQRAPVQRDGGQREEQKAARPEAERPRRSVKVHLNEIKRNRSQVLKPHRARPDSPQR